MGETENLCKLKQLEKREKTKTEIAVTAKQEYRKKNRKLATGR